MSDRGDWLYHLSAFREQVQESGAHGVLENLEVDFGGVLYHHRGARVPGHNATFVDRDDGTFELVVDGIGDRAAWARFDDDRSWDFFVAQPPDDAPHMVWICDAEFEAEEAAEFEEKPTAVGMGRFSFGLYLQSPAAWTDLEERAREVDAPCFVYRPSGRTLVPDGDLSEYEDALPAELLGGDPPAHLGVVDADFGL